ncbi:MAG TPA: hypothetical protein VGO84_06390 [Burkholderiales bacterium]|jgi:hypothetical protein|nr:hypothetical protein [Burkholderiales bacterium]
MKTLLAAAGLVAVVSMGSPASAQVYGEQWGGPALDAYAQAHPTAQQRRNLNRQQQAMHPDGRVHAPDPTSDVYDTQDRYVGSDPDPFIRNDLARSAPDRDGG